MRELLIAGNRVKCLASQPLMCLDASQWTWIEYMKASPPGNVSRKIIRKNANKVVFLFFYFSYHWVFLFSSFLSFSRVQLEILSIVQLEEEQEV